MTGKATHRLRLSILLLSVFCITVGYGVSFPFLAIRLEEMSVGAALIGVNAAMPALGWLILTPLLPRLHQSCSAKTLMIFFLGLALLGLWGFATVEHFSWWLLFRFAFGGGLGMFFRVVEYWLNTATNPNNRGRVIGTYSTCFLFGIAVGSLLQPSLNTLQVDTFLAIGLPIFLGGLFISLLSLGCPSMPTNQVGFRFLRTAFLTAPLAMTAVVIYGMFEDVPAYLLSVYTLQVGLGEDIAAYTLTAFALGNLIFAIPLGALSDKFGRGPIMSVCALVGLSGTIGIPFLTGSVGLYLGLIAIWGGFVGGLYNVALAYIGDNFSDDALITANTAFGTVYAAAAMLGPLVNGTAMQIWSPHGLMLSSAAIFSLFFLVRMVTRNTTNSSSLVGDSQ